MRNTNVTDLKYKIYGVYLKIFIHHLKYLSIKNLVRFSLKIVHGTWHGTIIDQACSVKMA